MGGGCSHLIAAIYTDAGFPLINKPVYKITPNELLGSEFLEDITDKVIFPYSDIALQRVKNKGGQINCLDAGGNTLSKDAQNHRNLLNNNKRLFTRNGLIAPHRCGEFPEILTNRLNQNFTKKLDYQLSKEYKK
jgi:hypothetical protein